METGFDPVQVGYGFGVPVPGMPLTSTDPTQEYVAGAFGRLTPRIPQLLPVAWDDISKNFGIRTYYAMLTDPAVKSSFMSLLLGALEQDLEIMPAIPVRPWQKKLDADQAMAVQCKEFCERGVQRLETPFDQTLLQLGAACAFGVKLAEVTDEPVETGLDKGKLQLRSVKVKPYWAWQFIVDVMMNVKGILTFLPAGPLNPDAKWNSDLQKAPMRSGYVILPATKFLCHTWMPEDNDPRGTSVLRAAYAAWNLKLQVLPYAYQHLIKFGSPGLDLEMAPNDNAKRQPIDPKTGMPIQGVPPVDAATYMSMVLAAYQNNGILVRPNGSMLNVISSDKAEALWKGFEWFDQQIVLAIELQTMATLEAKHSSKAHGQIGQDTKGTVQHWIRRSLCGCVRRQLFYRSIVDNFGEEIADRFTPIPTLGKAMPTDLPARWTAFANMGRTFTLTFSQIAEFCADNGLPVPDPEEYAAEQQQRQEQALAIRQAAPADPDEGQGGEDGELADNESKEQLKANPNKDNEDNEAERESAGKSL